MGMWGTGIKPIRWLIAATLLNFVAQVPYYYYQYYRHNHIPPSPTGAILMLVVFIWFLTGIAGIYGRRRFGYYATLAFVLVEALFYVQTQIAQYITTGSILLYVWKPTNPLLFAVFGIGYINMVVAALFAYYMIVNRKQFLL